MAYTLTIEYICDCCGEPSARTHSATLPVGWADTAELGLICPECVRLLMEELEEKNNCLTVV